MENLGASDKEACSTWIEIDLGILRNNFHLLEKKAGKPVMPVVKANAYGLGLVEISKALEAAGAKWLGVARIEEAMALRNAGVHTKILVLGYTPPKRIPDAIQNRITVTIYDQSVVGKYVEQARLEKGVVEVHVKVDTGMGRLGVFDEEAYAFVKWLQNFKEIDVTGIFTHFARADTPIYATTEEQIKRFVKLLDELKRMAFVPEQRTRRTHRQSSTFRMRPLTSSGAGFRCSASHRE